MRRADLDAYLADLLTRHRAATALNRYRALHRFFAWLAGEEVIPRSPMERMRPPTVRVAAPDVLTPDEFAGLLAVCDGTSFADRRDHAILSLFYDTGMRRGELASMTVGGTDLERQVTGVSGKTGPRAAWGISPAEHAAVRHILPCNALASDDRASPWPGPTSRLSGFPA